MNDKFSKNDLLEMIDSRLTQLTEEEIIELITEELNKENSQVDMDYVDVCYDLLELKRNNEINITAGAGRIKTKRPIKALLIAAVFVCITVSTFAVSAQVFNFNIPQRIAEFINGNAKVGFNLENADTTADGYALLDTDLAKKLLDYGITPVTFPEEMLKEDCIITEIENKVNDENMIVAAIVFEYKGEKGYLAVEQLAEDLDIEGDSFVKDIKTGQMIRANGMDVLVFEMKNSCVIRYSDNKTNYTIALSNNLETAIQFAESIK